MTRDEFREGVAVILEVDPAQLAPDTVLAHVGSWDSLAQMAVIALAMEYFEEAPNPQRLADCETFGDLVELFAGQMNG